MNSKNTSLILGKGYTGKVLLNKLSEPVFWTSRKPQNDQQSIVFDLNEPNTWKNLPQVDQTFWLFACDNLDNTKAFWESHKNQLGQVVVVSTTSCLSHTNNQTVDENCEWNLDRVRCQCEAYLLKQGATIVMSSGIYGPGRNPLRWLEKGLIQDEKGWVNLIHVEDLAQIILQATKHPGQTFLANDNQKYIWKDILEFAKEKKWLDDNLQITNSKTKQNKLIDANHTLKTLHVTLKYPTLYDWLNQSS